MSLLSSILGIQDEATKGEIRRLSQRSSFSKFLPYISYDPDTKLYENTDETVGFLFECSPLCFAGTKTMDDFMGLFRQGLPNGSVIQFILYADRDIKFILDGFQDLKQRPNMLVERSAKNMASYFTDGVRGVKSLSGIPIRNFRIFVALKVPVTAVSNGLNMKEVYSLTRETLHGAGLQPVDMNPARLLDWGRKLFNVWTALDSTVYDENREIKKQMILAESAVKVSDPADHLGIAGRHFKCLTPKHFPANVDPAQTNEIFGGIWGLQSDGDQYTTPFLYSLNIVFEDLKMAIHRKTSIVLWQKGVGSFAMSLARKQAEYQWAADEAEKGTVFFRIIPTLWLFDEDPEMLMTSVSRARRIWESQGYIMQEDRVLLPILFISSLPFGLYTNDRNVESIDRDFWAPAESITYILPVQSDFAGFGEPHVILAGRKGQLAGVDIYAKGADNHNALIAASSGKGKSFFINFLVACYYAAMAKIRLIDIGGSYKKVAKMYGGRYLEFSSDSHICLPPFANVNADDDEDFAGDIFNIASIVNQMIHSTTDLPERDPETTMSLIKQAVRWAWEQEGAYASVDTVHSYLSEFKGHASQIGEGDYEREGRRKHRDHIRFLAQGLAYNLQDFTSKGMYGKWFNGKSTLNIADDDFVVLELEKLMAQKELFKVVTLQVINAVTADLYLDRLRAHRRLILFEEAWKFLLMKSQMISNSITEGYRRARKYKGSFSVVVQSLLDIRQFDHVGDVIMANSDFKFLLESPDFEKAKESKIVDYDDFVMRLIKTVRSNKPKYSEMFVQSPFGMGIGRLVVDPFSYYMATSDGDEVGALERLCDSGMTYADAIEVMIKKHRGNGNGNKGNGSN